jgi:hypothetical protein
MDEASARWFVPKTVKNGFHSSFVYWRARLPLNATNPPEAISRNAAIRTVCQVQDEGCTIFARPPTIKKLNNAAATMNSALATISRRAIFVTSPNQARAGTQTNWASIRRRSRDLSRLHRS